MNDTLTIPARFRGPPAAGNGGYVAGRLAAWLDGPAEITLRAPTPVDTALDVVRDDTGLRLLHGDTLIAEAVAKPLPELTLPPLPSPAEAEAATTHGGSPNDSNYGQCFVCGRGLPAHLGLRVHTGWMPERGIVAALWRPHAAFCDADGRLDPAFAWGALDCPGGFAAGNGIAGSTMYLTGRLHAAVDAELRAGEPYMVIGWPLEKDGRKVSCGTAICTPDGAVLAKAFSLWIEMRPGF